MEADTGANKKEADKPPVKVRQPQYLAHLIKYFKYAGVLFLVWNVGFWRFSPSWVLLALFFYMINEEYRKTKEGRIAFAKHAMEDEKGAILARTDELPSWVFFPDVERAEWLNKMVKQMWPFFGQYLQTLLKTSIQPSIDNALPNSLRPFKFERIDFGNVPPRIGGVKVYIENLKKDEIILDLELFYSSDSTIKMAIRGLTAGIKDLTLTGHLRVVMKPLVSVMPIIGGMNIFFLNPPSLDFDLTDVANVLDTPLLSNTLRSVLIDQISYYLVLPNKIPIQMVENVNMDALLYPIPQGVLRLHIVGARELKRADIKVIGKGKSDPYCKIYVGAQVFKTKVIKDSIQPTWNAYFEAVVDQKHGQFVEIECLDEDPGEDDELGVATIDIQNVAEKGEIDTWLPLEGVDTGMIHVRGSWLHLSRDMDDLERQPYTDKMWLKRAPGYCQQSNQHVQFADTVVKQNQEEHDKSGSEQYLASALLMVHLDSAKNLPRSKKSMSEPSPYAKLSVGNSTKKSIPIPKSSEPKWEENFNFLVNDPRNQDLFIELLQSGNDSNLKLWDSHKEKRLGNLTVSLKEILKAPKMMMHRSHNLKDSGDQAAITLRLCLRVLTSEKPDGWEADIPEHVAQKVNDPGNPGTSVDNPGSAAAPPAASAAAGVPPSPAAATPSGQPDPTLPEPHPDDVQMVSEATPMKSSPEEAVLARSGGDLRQRPGAVAGKPDPGLGKVQMTFRYSQQRGKLVCSVHKCIDLMACDDENNSDPYVRIYLLPGHKEKRKTQVVKNNLNPIFDETFDWSIPWNELQGSALEVMVKNSTGVFSSEKKEIGQVNIDLGQLDLTNSITEWYTLQVPDE